MGGVVGGSSIQVSVLTRGAEELCGGVWQIVADCGGSWRSVVE